MYRIGIIGTENSHAMAFAKYYNLPDPDTGKFRHEEVRVVAVMGDEESTSAIVRETGVELVVNSPEEMLGKVDAVMITSRRGSVHMQYALPFIAHKIPLFIDKPFTSDPAEADALIAQIIANDCPVAGGSACKYLPAILEIRDLVAKLRQEDSFISAAMSFRVDLDSIYDGIYFYSPHLVEMCLAAFGMDVKTVQATRTGKSMIVTAQYENDAVSLHFVRAGKQSCVVFGKEQNYYFDIDITGLYDLEAAPFAELIQGKHPSLPAEVLVKPVHMIAAIKESLESGKAVRL